MKQGFNSNSLKKFLIKVTDLTWASDNSEYYSKKKDGSHNYLVENGDWKYTDWFHGGEPYGGSEVVFFKNNPMWMNLYYGWVDKNQDINKIYNLLKSALNNKPDDFPVRGPNTFNINGHLYKNKWTGNIEQFTGEEKISLKGKIIYRASYMGGLVDQKR